MRDTSRRVTFPGDGNRLVAIALGGLRVVYGLYWLYSAAWKIPLEVGRSGERSLWYWLMQGVQHPTLAPYAAFVREVVLPNFLLFGAVVFLIELFIGLSLVSGALTRMGTLVGMGMSLAIFLAVGSVPGESPLFYLGLFLVHLLLFLTRSGRYYGLHAVLSRHFALFVIVAVLGVACQSMPSVETPPPVPDQTLGVVQIADDVVRWHAAHPKDWRASRLLIRDAYDVDRAWNAASVNFASTLMALLYGDGDFERTVTLAVLAGWDSDCNATTAAGLVGITHGYSHLPSHIRVAAGPVYVNVDVTGVFLSGKV